MSKTTRCCIPALLVVCTTFAIGKPLRERPSTAISVINAARVGKIDELARDVRDIVWIPKHRQAAFLSWERPVEVVEPKR